MPVRWIYVLQDGTMITPTTTATSNGKIATFAGSNVPTATNPIVGRIAYWTDDETCKVNINTASEGVYWDMPRIFSLEDVGRWNGTSAKPSVPSLSLCQPARNEFQRYPGHPATTSLSPIFGNLDSFFNLPTGTTDAGNAPIYQRYYDLAPRITGGGSNAGSTIPNPDTTDNNGQLGSITTDSDRLYASADELLFRQPLSNDPSASRPVNNVGLTKDILEKTKFFLTAHSSAPEVTIFNTPRVSMWPVWTSAAQRTLLDRTLSFCANLQANRQDTPYYFTRSQSRSMTADYAGSPRNQQLYAYLKRLMSKPVPGFGGKFSDTAALGIDSDQVLTSIYDYVRCINMYDFSQNGNTAATPYTGHVRIGDAVWGGGEVLPIKINNTQGFGRFATLAGMDLVFAGVRSPADTTINPDRTQVLLVPTFFSPMQGLPGMWPHMSYTITGQEHFQLNGKPIFLPGGKNWITNIPVQEFDGRGMGSMISPRASLARYNAFDTKGPLEGKSISPGGSDAPSNPPNYSASGSYPFVSYNPDDQTFNIPLAIDPDPASKGKALSSQTFTGGNLTVTLYLADETGTDVPVQSFVVNFPSTAFPPPTLAHYPLFKTATPSYLNRISVDAGDVVRGVEVAGAHGESPADMSSGTNTTAGDARLLAALSTVTADYYHPHKDYNSLGKPYASGMMDDDGSNTYLLSGETVSNIGDGSSIGRHGSLAAGIYPRNSLNRGPSYKYKSPYVPSRTVTDGVVPIGVTRTNGDATTPGDWDSGYALMPDGAHINMTDIGDEANHDEVNLPISFAGPRFPYVQKEDHFNNDRGAGSYFSASRQVPSSMMLGSIPTGVQRRLPWQTLLFNPKPEDPNHPGRWVRGTTPPDHLIADLFWMPVVEPYPISQPFSTAGKINMNYQIEPFSYITRATGIYSVMKSTKMMAILPAVYFGDPKPLISSFNQATNPAISVPLRYSINVKETLKGFADRFASNDIFRSASQISEINLVPQYGGVTYDTASMAAFWKARTVTGDNLREKPYADIYPRLTTKSNAYTVHFRVQVLQKVPNSAANQWSEGIDQVLSEYRGSSEIERYLDSNDTNLPDFAPLVANGSTSSALDLDKYYRYRVVSTKRFSPY